MSRIIKIGTRKSPLAMAQTRHVAQALCAAHDWPEARVEIIPLSTHGDKILDRPLAEIGGKGLFTHELETGLHEKSLDLAVHSLKDLPTKQPEGLMLACVPPREDARDALIIAKGLGRQLQDLPAGASIGSASLRRIAQILRARPDLQPQSLRGNVATRISKLSAQGPHATLLAMAGLNRLGMADMVTQILPTEIMLPAAGQGALGLQTRADDAALKALLAPLHCAQTAACVTAERAYLGALEGSCRTPIAALAIIFNDQLILTARLMSEDGEEIGEVQCAGKTSEAEDIGLKAAHEMKSKALHLIPEGDLIVE